MLGATFCPRKSSIEPKKPSYLSPDRGTRSQFESFNAHKRYWAQVATSPPGGRNADKMQVKKGEGGVIPP